MNGPGEFKKESSTPTVTWYCSEGDLSNTGTLDDISGRGKDTGKDTVTETTGDNGGKDSSRAASLVTLTTVSMVTTLTIAMVIINLF